MLDKGQFFKSERLSYRGISEADAPLIVAWRSDPNNSRWFFAQAHITLESHLAWFNNYLQDDTRYEFLMFDEKHRPIGTVGISNLGQDSCEVNYMVGEADARNKGYATEAVRAICSLAFQELGVTFIEAHIDPHNTASIATAKAAGLVEKKVVYRISKDACSAYQ